MHLEPGRNTAAEFDLGRPPGLNAADRVDLAVLAFRMSACVAVVLGLIIYLEHRRLDSYSDSVRTLNESLAANTSAAVAIGPSAGSLALELPTAEAERSDTDAPVVAKSKPKRRSLWHDSFASAPIISDADTMLGSAAKSAPESETASAEKSPATSALVASPDPSTGSSAVPASIPTSAFPTDERIWTRISGKYLMATALAYDEGNGTVMLRSSDGRVLSNVAIEDLSTEDLAFLTQLAESP